MPTPPPAPAPTATETETETEEKEPEPAEGLRISETGELKLSLLVQAWFLLQNQDSLSEARDTLTTFRPRRAEIRLKGYLVKDSIEFGLMIDPAKTLKFGSESREVTPAVNASDPNETDAPSVEVPTPPNDTSILQDYSITALTQYADVSIGQFKIPLGLESNTSSASLLFPERSSASRHFADRRDVGVKAEKKFGLLRYVVGAFNGAGQNRLDTNNQKDVYARIEVSPIEGLMIGGVAGASLLERDTEASTKERLEADLKLEIADLLLQGEYHHGWDGPTEGDGRVQGHAFYAALGYTFLEKLQPVVRVNYVDPNIDVDETRLWEYEAGLNYLALRENLKLQVAYSYADADDEPVLHTATGAAQLKF